MLLTTTAMFWEMLFGEKNAHLQGLNRVRERLMMMADDKAKFPPLQYANIIWEVYDDSVRHLNQVMPYDDLLHESPCNLQFPASNLGQFALGMGSYFAMDIITLPQVWRDAAERRGRYGSAGANARGGGWQPTYGGGGNNGRDKRSPGGQRNGGRNGNKNKRGQDQDNEAGDGDDDNGTAASFREKHPDRYGNGTNSENTNVHPTLKMIMDPITADDGYIPTGEVLRAGGVSFHQVKKWETHTGGICPAFATGKCRNPKCEAQHLLGRETPTKYINHLAGELKEGVEKVAQDGIEKWSFKKTKRSSPDK